METLFPVGTSSAALACVAAESPDSAEAPAQSTPLAVSAKAKLWACACAARRSLLTFGIESGRSSCLVREHGVQAAAGRGECSLPHPAGRARAEFRLARARIRRVGAARPLLGHRQARVLEGPRQRCLAAPADPGRSLRPYPHARPYRISARTLSRLSGFAPRREISRAAAVDATQGLLVRRERCSLSPVS